MASKAPVTQSGSKLLSGEENDQIFRLLGFRCQVMIINFNRLKNMEIFPHFQYR